MIVPQYWAETRLHEKNAGQSYTIRRYGWSDVSQEDAQRVADERAREAMARILAGEPLPRREKKTSYGIEGVPIREEIVERHGETVITRNIYGARCLNTPNAFFIDVDFSDKLPDPVGCALFAAGFVAPLVGLFFMMPFWRFAKWVIPATIPAAVCGGVVVIIVGKVWSALRGGPELIARRRIDRFFARRDMWRWRLYRTPRGWRILVIHRPFDPEEAQAQEAFQGLGADPLFALLCRKQRCFRARVSPKPWRMGVQRMPPQRAVWPIPEARMPERLAWIEEYERVAIGYAACRFEGEFGEGIPDSSVAAVQRLHDQLCRAESGLPIA